MGKVVMKSRGSLLRGHKLESRLSGFLCWDFGFLLVQRTTLNGSKGPLELMATAKCPSGEGSPLPRAKPLQRTSAGERQNKG